MDNNIRNVFTYGSLMYPEVMYKLVKGQNYQNESGVIKNFSRRQVKG